jgi:hypothetical protein
MGRNAHPNAASRAAPRAWEEFGVSWARIISTIRSPEAGTRLALDRVSLDPGEVSTTMGTMTEEQGTAAPLEELDQDEYWSARKAHQPDHLLADLVEAAEEKGQGGTVTLTVGGVLITGNMVSRRKWADAYERRWPELAPLTARWRKSWDDYDESWSRYDDTPTPRYAEFIHLTDARIVNPSGELPAGETAEGLLWRGRLTEVQGWGLGKLTVTVQSVSSEVT